MKVVPNLRNWRMLMRRLAFIGVLAILVAVGAAIFFFGGFFNVAASEEDSGGVAWALAYIRAASIARHATEQPPISLEDPAIVQAGARAYVAAGCVNCHGAPGVKWQKFSEGMQPYPADLKEVAPAITGPQIFFVVKNGIKFTGMPNFGSEGVSDQDIWKITAFVKKWPSVSDADFKTWTAAAP
jgi:mono/diheme cytochrome c family protein